MDMNLQFASVEFNKIGMIDETVISPRWTQENLPEKMAEGLLAFQVALTMNMAQTCRYSVHQIHTCLEIARLAQFYADDVSRNRRLRTDRGVFNDEVLRVTSQLREQSLSNVQGFLGNAFQVFGLGKLTLDSPAGESLKAAMNETKAIASVADTDKAVAEVYLNLRKKNGLDSAIFPKDQKPELHPDERADTKSVELYRQTAQGFDQLIQNTEETLRLMLSRAFYIRSVVIPSDIRATTAWEEDIAYNRNFVGTVVGWIPHLERFKSHAARFGGISPH